MTYRSAKHLSLSVWLTLTLTPGLACSERQDVAREQAPEEDARQELQQSNPPPAAVDPQDVETPEAPTSSRPSFASQAPAVEGRPPHPAIPEGLAEPAPSPDVRASSAFRWLPGHWIWDGNRYVWQPGLWIYDVPGHALVPAQWIWDGDYWGFRDAGWAARGATRVSYRPTAAPVGSASLAPEVDLQAPDVDVFVPPSSYAVYAWTGTWVAPPIVYPSEGDLATGNSRYAPRYRSATEALPQPQAATESDDARTVIIAPPEASRGIDETAEQDEVELVPGVMHGGKRGEEELRLMEEAERREAEEEAEGVDSVYVPFYYDPHDYQWNYPARPRPPRPRPPPARPTPPPPRPVRPKPL